MIKRVVSIVDYNLCNKKQRYNKERSNCRQHIPSNEVDENVRFKYELLPIDSRQKIPKAGRLRVKDCLRSCKFSSQISPLKTSYHPRAIGHDTWKVGKHSQDDA